MTADELYAGWVNDRNTWITMTSGLILLTRIITWLAVMVGSTRVLIEAQTGILNRIFQYHSSTTSPPTTPNPSTTSTAEPRTTLVLVVHRARAARPELLMQIGL